MIHKITFLLFSFTTLFGEEIDLSRYEKSLYSQNGEDGVLSKIFQLIDSPPKFCVEFSAQDGITGSNTHLFRLQGWDTLSFDRAHESPEEGLYKEFITAENINELFEKYGVPFHFSLLSIHTGYNDFHLWKAIDAGYYPDVIVIETNPTLAPTEDKVVKYRPYYVGDTTTYYGASILALYNLGKSKGYSLIYAEKNGVHLFFMKDELLAENNLSFKNMGDVEKLYRKNSKTAGIEDFKNREYSSSTQLLNL